MVADSRADGPDRHAEDGPSELAFVFTGGGARGAYQVGFLRYVAQRYPDLRIPILTGVSAGALNAVHLANQHGKLVDKVDELTRLWTELSIDDVFRIDAPSLFGRAFAWVMQLGLWGGTRKGPTVRGLVDTTPLYSLLKRVLTSSDGSLPGIALNLARGDLTAVAVTTTEYATGQTVTWCQGRSIQEWDRPQRRSHHTTLRIEHALASAALPVFFPAVRIDRAWYGDGAIRLHAPLAPAIHLGAERIVAISTRHACTQLAIHPTLEAPYPQPAEVLGVLLNSIFLDLLDQDATRLERINRLIAGCAGPLPEPLRSVDLLVLRPSRDLAEIAGEYESQLPSAFRWMLRRLGTHDVHGHDLLSVLLFQGAYAQRLIELGEADAKAREREIAELIEGPRKP